ncbi:MAG TPA: hypothetical protein VGC62_11560 [Pseudomonas sp.]|uniref:hypothetical protein n=1 Tax=Pseudomonas sp. TaxID=306 RepID=UPI002EDA1148
MRELDAGLVALLIMVPFVLNAVFLLGVAILYVDEIEERLGNSKLIRESRAMFVGFGFWSVCIRVGLAALVLTGSSRCVKRGLVNVDDIDQFPRGLRLLIQIPWALELILAFALLVFYGWATMR